VKRLVVLISGRGSNMKALLEARLPAEIAAVISNEPRAAGLETAQRADVRTEVIDHRRFPDRASFDAALADAVDRSKPHLVVLAGFMRVLGDAFVARFSGRLINVHPSLLPAFPGMRTHQRALEAGVRIHGCTVHFVTAALDAGPIIIQAAVPVYVDDTEQTLAARVLAEEHRVLPEAVRWFLDERLQLQGTRVTVAGPFRYPPPVTVPTVS